MSAYLHAVAMAYPQSSATQQRLCDIALETSSGLEAQGAIVQRLYRGANVETRGAVILNPNHDPSHASQTFFSMSVHEDPAISGLSGIPARDGLESQQGAVALAAETTPTTSDRMKVWLRELTPIAIQASRDALRESGFSCNSVTHLITASCTGFASPGIDHTIMQELGLRETVQRVHVGFMGCHGAINALRVAQGMIALNATNVALVVAAEACSVHFQTADLTADRIVANALFADGAGACVLAGRDANTGTSNKCSGLCGVDERRRPLGTLVSTASWTIPGTQHAMSWTIGDQGFVMSLSRDVPSIIERTIRSAMEAWLCQHDLKIKDIGAWCVHPGGPKVLDAVQRALGLSNAAVEPSRRVLREHGNMSSPTVLAIMKSQVVDYGALQTPCVLIAFGPGLTCEAALIMSGG